MRDRRLAQIELRIDVGPEGAVPLLRADLLDALVGPLHGGVIHQDVESAEVAQRLLDYVLAVLLLGDVPRGATRLPPSLFDPACGLLLVLVLVQIGDQEIRALTRE